MRDVRDDVRKHNAREYMYDAVHQNLNIEVNSTRIKTLYKAPIRGVRYKANSDTIIKGLLDVKPIADASQEIFLNKVLTANQNTTSLAGQVPDFVKPMYVIPSRAQVPDLRTMASSSDSSSSYTMPRTRDFVNSCNNIFTLLQSNSAYSTTPIMSYSTYGPSAYNVQTYGFTLTGDGWVNTSDSNPFWNAPTTQNAIWSFADSACTNVAAVSAILMTWRQDRILLDVFSKRHPELAGWLQNAKAMISSPRFRALLENIARLIARIPVDIDWVDRVVRLSTAISQKGDSIFDPVIYTTASFMMPAYQIGTSTTPGSGYLFTPDFRNTSWRTENAPVNSAFQAPFYCNNVAFGTTPYAPGLVTTLPTSTDPASTVNSWVSTWYTNLSTTLSQASSLVSMYEPWTALVRLAAQSGFSKWFGYAVPYLEAHKESYEPNIHNLLKYPSVSMKSFNTNGTSIFRSSADRGVINEDSVSPYKLFTISTEYAINNTNTDTYDNNYPHFAPVWDGNTIGSTEGVIENAPYQFPELLMYTFIYVTTFNGNQYSISQEPVQNILNAGSYPYVYSTSSAWVIYYGYMNYNTPDQIDLTSNPIGTPTYNYLVETLGSIAFCYDNTPSSSSFYYSPILSCFFSEVPLTVMIPDITIHLQNDFRATSPFREVMKNPGDVLLLG